MYKLIVIFILSIFSISCRKVDSQKKLLKATQITDSLIVIINNTNNKQYLFKYIGYFGNSERIGFTKGDTLTIHSIKSITGYKANKPDFSDIRYYNLSPGDTLIIGPNEKFYSNNKSLNGKIKLMDELLFNASSINYTLKDNYDSGIKHIRDNYQAKLKIIQSFTGKIDNEAINQAQDIVFFEMLTGRLSLSEKFNKKNDSLIVINNANSNDWNYLTFRSALQQYALYVQKLYKVSTPSQYVKFVETNLKPSVQEYAIFNYINTFNLNNTSIDTIRKLIVSFDRTSAKIDLKDYLNTNLKNYTLTLDVKESKGIQLATNSDNVISLESILSQYKGNIIYIDFWASWCAPCLAEMPNSSQLANELSHNKTPVIFLYLSEDSNMSAWKFKAKEIKLPANKSFLLLRNTTFKEFAQKIKLNSIPRYIIIGKNGTMINPDAPRPSDEKLKNILNKLSN